MASGGNIPVGNTEIEYIRFGKGSKTMVMIPGVGDGLKTVKGTAIPFSVMYHMYRRDFTVYIFSRRNILPDGFTNRNMAKDLAFCFSKLGIQRACVLGVSQGGMIAQWLAIDFPEMVDKLLLCVTTPALSEERRSMIRQWMAWAKEEN